MKIAILYYVSALGLSIIWALILWRGAAEAMLRRYALFYCYTAAFAAAYLGKLAAAHFMTNEGYAAFYFWSSVAQKVVAIAVLYRIFSVCGRPGSGRRWLVSVAIPVSAFLVTAIEKSDSHVYLRVLAALYIFVMALGAANISRLRGIVLGNNYYAMLGGILFPNILAAMAHLAYFSRFEWWPRSFLVYLGEPIVWLSWLIILAGMWRCDPPELQETLPRDQEVGREVVTC